MRYEKEEKRKDSRKFICSFFWLDGDKYVFSYEKDRDENYYKEFEADNIRDLIRKAKEPQDGS